MENQESKNLSSLNFEIEKIIREEKILWQDSLKKREALKKTGSILTPVAIVLILFIIPVFNIFQIKNSYDFLIGFLVSVFLLWLWYKFLKSLILSGNLISPWVLGLVDRAREVLNQKKPEKMKKTSNLFLGIFFVFIGLFFSLAGSKDLFAKSLSIGFGVMFLFLGSVGITNYAVANKPERVLFLLKNNKKINFIIFSLFSMFCLTILAVIFLEA